jgi:hypothetical protein
MAEIRCYCLTIGNWFVQFLCNRLLYYANLGSHGTLSFVEFLTSMLIIEKQISLKIIPKCRWIIWMRPTTTSMPHPR